MLMERLVKILQLLHLELLDDFSGYLKFTHDGGSEVDSVLVKGMQ